MVFCLVYTKSLNCALLEVRFYACESLYNVVKVLRENVMPLFNEGQQHYSLIFYISLLS